MATKNPRGGFSLAGFLKGQRFGRETSLQAFEEQNVFCCSLVRREATAPQLGLASHILERPYRCAIVRVGTQSPGRSGAATMPPMRAKAATISPTCPYQANTSLRVIEPSRLLRPRGTYLAGLRLPMAQLEQTQVAPRGSVSTLYGVKVSGRIRR